jgi:Isoleucyl-tRNA synthetase
MDYKETLNMPNTEFEMRGNLAKKEPGILKQWEDNNYYQNLLAHHKGQKAFILHEQINDFEKRREIFSFFDPEESENIRIEQ